MKKFLIAFIFIFGFTFLFAQPKPQINRQYTWPKPTANDMVFYFLSADKKPRELFVLINKEYVPLRTETGYGLGRNYTLPKSSNIVFFSHKLKDGEDVFTREIAVDTNGLIDFALGLFEVEGKLHYKLLDMSLEAIPVGATSVINMQPIPIGVKTLSNAGRLGLYEKITQVSDRQDESKYGHGHIEVYSLQNPRKPGLLWPGDFRYIRAERMMLFVFGVKIKTSPYADESDGQLVPMADKGPR